MNKKLIRLAEVISKTGLSKSTINRLEEKLLFPSKIKIGDRIIAWDEQEIDSWIKQMALRSAKKIGAANE